MNDKIVLRDTLHAAGLALAAPFHAAPEFAAMTDRPVGPNPLVPASKALVQMSMATTRLTRGSRAAARIARAPPRENPRSVKSSIAK